jgi:hypothetical protein
VAGYVIRWLGSKIGSISALQILADPAESSKPGVSKNRDVSVLCFSPSVAHDQLRAGSPPLAGR